MKEIKTLEVVEMCITSKCNLKCKHCYQDAEKNQYQLSFNQIKDIVDYGAKHNVLKYVLSGGEFFMHPQAYDVISYIINNTSASITCVTNLTLLNLDKLDKIGNNNRISFKVSIDGDQEEHDKRRGEGMFKLTEEKIKLAREKGYLVDITMTLVEENIHCIPTVFENKVFDKVTLMPVAITGAACYNFSHKQDSPIYHDVICHIYKTCHRKEQPNRRCYIFPNSFSVKYDGGIYPCSLSRDYGLCKLGDIKNTTIEDVINKFIESKESDMFFEYLGNNQIEQCNSCPSNNDCTRGCRIRAFKWNGALTTSDPFACKIFRDAYKNIPFGEIYWGDKK